MQNFQNLKNLKLDIKFDIDYLDSLTLLANSLELNHLITHFNVYPSKTLTFDPLSLNLLFEAFSLMKHLKSLDLKFTYLNLIFDTNQIMTIFNNKLHPDFKLTIRCDYAPFTREQIQEMRDRLTGNMQIKVVVEKYLNKAQF